MCDILEELCVDSEFRQEYKDIIMTCINEFMKLNPSDVLHCYIDENSPHQERDLLSHVILALKALHKTDRYMKSGLEDKIRLVIAVLLHDVGKAILWKTINTSTGRWNFKGHDNVGACWFWALVKRMKWDKKFFRSVFLAIWYHMVKSKENRGLIHFLKEHGALDITECLHCADNNGLLEIQNKIPDILEVPNIPEFAELPNVPIVVYICGKSGCGKTTLAKTTIEKLDEIDPNITTGYVSFDRSMMKTLGNITELWADADPLIRGNSLKEKSKYKELYDIYQKNSGKREQVRKVYLSDFKESLNDNIVTFLTTTASKPSSHSLPFLSQKQINIVTVPDREDCMYKFFGTTKIGMEATIRGCGWASKGALIYVPEKELISCVKHIVKCRTLKLNPPSVSRPYDLISLFDYWEKITGSVNGVKYAIESFYDISVVKTVVLHGDYYNFAYHDGAPYDDPFHKGKPSPAVFCRGTTFHYDNDGWKLVRLPMNRGREIAFTPFSKEEAEDANISTVFYSNMIRDAIDSEHLITAKVDGSLLIVFIDKYGLQQNPRLSNRHNIIFGTKGMVEINTTFIDFLCSAITASGHTIESFSDTCHNYMIKYDLFSLSFEMVAEKRDELVVNYPHNYRGLYFLGGSHDDIFEPYFKFETHPVSIPETKNMDIISVSSLLLGPFPDHIEGCVIWIKQDNLFYPLKLKTMIYYLMHKPKNRKEYINYLVKLIEEYGWHGPTSPTINDLDENRLILSLFSLVKLPDVILRVLPVLYKSRLEYDRLSSISDDKSNELLAKELQAWYRFKSIYGNEQYRKAYELC